MGMERDDGDANEDNGLEECFNFFGVVGFSSFGLGDRNRREKNEGRLKRGAVLRHHVPCKPGRNEMLVT